MHHIENIVDIDVLVTDGQGKREKIAANIF